MILSIKGHETRGKEVIQLLEMLGGENRYNCDGALTNRCYYIYNDNNKICHRCILDLDQENVIAYTLEEFEEKFPYKVDDVVVNHKYGKGDITQMLWIDNEIVYEIEFEDYMAYCKANELCKYDAFKGLLLQELTEYLSHATREELDKTMDEIEIALAPFKVGDKVIVKGYEEMGEDEIIYVFKTYDGDVKYKTKNHLETHYFMEDRLTKVEKSYKEETMEEDKKVKGYCTEEPEDSGKTKKIAWFTFWDNDFADEVELYLKDRELVQKDGKWFVVKKNLSQLNLNELERKLDEALKEETMEERKYADLRFDVDQDDKLATEVTIDGNKITPPKNYLIGKITKVDNGMLIEFVKKQPQYPKDYEECESSGFSSNPVIVAMAQGVCMNSFAKLIVIRNTYWEIAGKQLGLDKPWEYDMSKDEFVYAIVYQYGYIQKCEVRYKNHILAFPTAEMRDAFYENFKKLIEQCKELL